MMQAASGPANDGRAWTNVTGRVLALGGKVGVAAGEVTGGVFVGYGVVIGLARRERTRDRRPALARDQAGQVAGGANPQAAPATAQTTWRIEPEYGRAAVSQS